MPGCIQLPRRQREPVLHDVQDLPPAGVHRPEEVVPAAMGDMLADSLGQALLDVVAHHRRELERRAEHQAGRVELPFGAALAFGQHRLRGGHHLEHLALIPASADDDGARAIAEQRLPDDRVDMPLLGRAEQGEAELGADDEHARAGVVLGEVLCDAEHGGGCGAPVEVHRRALH
ncbi:Os11g0529150 [Oryza sativa Japonica Group]|uniref:Os11g0529150 protein n=1 Tax=Oryza sativa subsp. japonica TaxID=39947 RepID=A0A0P0Y353_ORYSJ|nr:hypothetical protein EE612_055888 [Oryza sativa]BAT14269.1 Os11g0529150 [Oryza sativa Japonica Group]